MVLKLLKHHYGFLINLLLFVPPAIGGFRHSGAVLEEGIILSEAYLVSHGAIIYRDFNYMYGPGGLWLVAAFFKIFGSSLLIERVVGLIYNLSIIAGSYLVGLRYSRLSAFYICLLFTVSSGAIDQFGGEYAWPFKFAIGLSLVVFYFLHLAIKQWQGKNSAIAAFLVGFIISIVVILRFDFALPFSLALIPVLLIYFKKIFKPFFLGFLLAPLAYIVQIILAGWGPTFYQVVINPQRELPGNSLPLPPPFSHFLGYEDRLYYLTSPPTWILRELPVPSQLAITFYLEFALLIGTFLIIAVLFKNRGKNEKPIFLLSMFLFALGLVPTSIERSDVYHVTSFIPIVVMVFIFALIELKPAHKLGIELITFFVIIGIFFFLIPQMLIEPFTQSFAEGINLKTPIAYRIINYGHEFLFGNPRVAKDSQKMLNFLDAVATPGQKLIVGIPNFEKTPINFDGFYYMLPQLKPGTKFVIFYPDIGLNHAPTLATELASSDIVITANTYDNWAEPNGSIDFGPPYAQNVFLSNYCLAGSWGNFKVYFNTIKATHKELSFCKNDWLSETIPSKS